MALFNFGKKKEEKKVSACCCGGAEATVEEKSGCCCGSAPKADNSTSCCCSSSAKGISSIKILGAGCKSCHQQLEYVKEAVKNLGLNIEVEYVTDMAKIMEYGVMSMPAIVINEKVVSMGKVLKTADVETLLKK